MDKEHEQMIIEAGIDSAVRGGARGEIQRDVQDVERMFYIWLDEGQPGPTKLAELSGVPLAMARKVLRSGEFQSRYMEESARFREVAAPYLRSRAQGVMDDVIDRLHQIVKDGDDRDSIAAGRVLASMVEPGKVEVNAQTAVVDARVLSITEKGLDSIEDVRKLVAAHIDANVGAVEEQRAGR